MLSVMFILHLDSLFFSEISRKKEKFLRFSLIIICISSATKRIMYCTPRANPCSNDTDGAVYYSYSIYVSSKFL